MNPVETQVSATTCEGCGGHKHHTAKRCRRCTSGEHHYTWKPPSETKVCTKCGEDKPLSEYHTYADKRRTGERRPMGRCKACHSKLAQDSAKKNPDAKRKTGAAYRRRNARRLKLKQYGLTEFQMLCMEANQHCTCAICGDVFESLVIDHDHKTGHVRGLLCNTCNLGLGVFHDDPKKLLRAIYYLLRNERISNVFAQYD